MIVPTVSVKQPRTLSSQDVVRGSELRSDWRLPSTPSEGGTDDISSGKIRWRLREQRTQRRARVRRQTLARGIYLGVHPGHWPPGHHVPGKPHVWLERDDLQSDCLRSVQHVVA